MITAQSLLFIGLAIAFSSASKLLQRYVLKDHEPYAFAWLSNVVATLIFLPFVLFEFSLPTGLTAWTLLITGSLLWTIISMSHAVARKATEISLNDPLGQTKLVWGLIFGIILLGEAITSGRILGTFIIFIGVSLLMWHPERKFGKLSDPGVQWTLATAFLSAIAALVDKSALQWFSPIVYAFLVFFFPSLLLSLFLPKQIVHVKHLLRRRWFVVISSVILITFAFYFNLRTFSLMDFSLAFPLFQLSTLVIVLGGMIFLKEREHFWQRIIAAILVIVGSIVIGL